MLSENDECRGRPGEGGDSRWEKIEQAGRAGLNNSNSSSQNESITFCTKE